MHKKFFFLMFFMSLAVAATFADDKRYDVPIGDSPQTGPVNAPVTIIEFLDYQ